MHWKNRVNQPEFAEKASHEKKSYCNHIGKKRVLYCHQKELLCGYETVLETRGRGDIHQKGDLFKAELFHNSALKYRMEITYVDILCKNFQFCYESERSTRILSSQLFDHTLRPFSDFSVIG